MTKLSLLLAWVLGVSNVFAQGVCEERVAVLENLVAHLRQDRQVNEELSAREVAVLRAEIAHLRQELAAKTKKTK